VRVLEARGHLLPMCYLGGSDGRQVAVLGLVIDDFGWRGW